jgi:hypothetical protein
MIGWGFVGDGLESSAKYEIVRGDHFLEIASASGLMI